MSGFAEVLLNQGYQISGSDVNHSTATARLQSLGANIFIGHRAEQVASVDVVVVSSAIAEDNVEVMAAREKHVPVVPRAEMLGELMRFCQGIAIAGTHGKTTTTSLITSLLAEGGYDPTFVIGGRLNSVGCNARLGTGNYFVAEADESDASFLYLKPVVAVVTNIDAEHMQTYHNDFEELKQTFLQFLQQLPFYGLAVLCIDDPVIKSFISKITKPLVTYGFSEEADIQIIFYEQRHLLSYFKIVRKQKGDSLAFQLNLVGKHNALNAAAALAVASELNLSDEVIEKTFSQFAGIGRRFQIYGNFMLESDKQITLVDDYGHHPKEVAVTLEAARNAWPERRLVMIYQPHRYTRTRDLFNEFVEVLKTVDLLLLLPVYSAGEQPITGADSQHLCETLKKKCGETVMYIEDPESLQHVLMDVGNNNDVVLMQGAGNIGSIARQLSQTLLIPELSKSVINE
jgi:UDP-N-acetylmuramate--alanine ligase